MTYLDDFDAVGLAELVRNGEVSAQEMMAATIDRIESRNPTINAVVRTMYDQAEQAVRDGLPQGPLTGVPLLLKDLRATYAGVPTTSGSRYLLDNVAPRDSELVARYKRAGMVILGKTNTPEFGGAPTTESSLYGATRNPWNLDHSAGGSSGGAAAAVAAGMVPLAHGSDGGGSVRIPAGCCGLFGFKATRAVNPSGPDYGEAWNGLSAEHVITRSVRDSAVVLDASSGPAPGDPYCAPPYERSFADEVGRDPGRLRIAIQTSTAAGVEAHPDCVAAVRDVARLLESLGHEIVEAKPTYNNVAAGGAFRLVIASNVNAALAQHERRTGRPPRADELENINRILAGEAARASASDFVEATWALHQVGRDVAPFFTDHDVLLAPTVSAPPVPLGYLDITSNDVDDYLVKVFSWIPYTAMANQAGLPSMSVPLVWNEAGLPIGTCFTSGFGRDGLLFRLAAQLEQARPWFNRRAPIAGG